jgi:hypothetical protein
MATNYVPKGANRASATARTRKAAQHTPLPPKPGREEASERYGEMTVAQLKSKARELGISPPPLRKGDLLNAILRAERASDKAAGPIRAAAARAKKAQAEEDVEPEPAPKAKAKVTVVPARGQGGVANKPQKVAKKAPSAAVETTGASGRSLPKAQEFARSATELGWAAGVAESEGDAASVTAKRGGEQIFIEWSGGVFQGDSCLYTIGSRTIKLKNASACKTRMALPEEKATEEASRVAVRRVSAPAVRKAAQAKALPFSEASLDQEVLDALYGRKITWTNGVSGEEESDRVPNLEDLHQKANAPKIDEGPRGRVVTFPGQSGYRSVLVAAIISVR